MALLLLAAAACGKKGPPLPPLAHVPASPGEVAITRAGSEVLVRFRIPQANTTGVQPADIERVDVYAWTGPQLPAEDMFKRAKVVASVPVRRPPPPPPPQKEGEPPPPPPPPPIGPGLDQGALAEVTETLGPDAFTPIVLPEPKTSEAPPVTKPLPLAPPDLGPPVPPPLVRWYVVVGVNRGGRRGQPAQRTAIALHPAPAPPTNVTAGASLAGVTLAWTSPASRRQPLQPNALPPRPAGAAGAAAAPARPAAPAASPAGPAPPPPAPPAADDDDEEPAAAQPGADADDDGAVAPVTPRAEDDDEPAAAPPATSAGQGAGTAVSTARTTAVPADGEAPAGQPAPPNLLPARLPFPWPVSQSGFNVYEVGPAAARRAGEAGQAAPEWPRLLTPAPLRVTTFTDPRVEYGVERCYAVRTVEVSGTHAVESVSSEPACVTPKDVFPPAAPKSLATVASAGAIGLIWEANTDADLAGYLVLRATAPGDALQPLTPEPIRETTFRDTTVTPGTRYVYAVVAVDTATPPNRSEPSNRAEETAR